MVSTRKKRQQNRKLLSQIDDFDQEVIICKKTNDEEQNVGVRNFQVDQEFTYGNDNHREHFEHPFSGYKSRIELFEKSIIM